MAYNFDGINRLIILSTGTTFVSVQDMYSRAKDAWLSGTHARYLFPFKVTGGEPIGSGKYTGQVYFLSNGWQIKPQSANHRLTVDGNLFRDPLDTDPQLPLDVQLPGYSISVSYERSNLAQGISTSGGSSTDPVIVSSSSVNAIAAAVAATFGTLVTNVWSFATRSLTGNQADQLAETHQILGLDSDNPVTASTVSRTSGTITQVITTNPDGSKTMERLP